MLGAGLSATGALYAVPWLVFFGAVIAALSVLVLTIWQNDSTERLLQQAHTIALQAKKIETLVTGGDGFAFLGISKISQNQFNFIAVNPGEGPLYELSVSIFDVTLSKTTSNRSRDYNWNRHQLNIGSLPAHSAKPTNYTISLLPEAKEQDYNIFFNARNGFWTQFIRFRKMENGWLWAERIDGREVGAPPLHEGIGDGYPRNSKGDVDWH